VQPDPFSFKKMAVQVPTTNDNSESEGKPAPGVLEIFLAFLGIGMMGFGGVLAIARRVIVEQRKWLAPSEFTDLLGLCQFLPGGNIMNLSVALGWRYRGWHGSVAAIVGLMAAPCIIVVALGAIYDRYESDPQVSHVFAALAAAAAGMLVGTSVKIAAPLRKKPAAALVAIVCFVAIAVFRTPLLLTMLVLAPLSVLIDWKFEQ
jgi:chromate transporter